MTIDEVVINSEKNLKETERVIKHLDRIRRMAGINFKAKVVSDNSFPKASGLASSASGFAALSVAGAAAAGLKLNEKELSILARQGSGSACRSIPNGFVEWLDGETSETSYAVSLHPADYWNLAIVVAVVDSEKKDIGSTEGQARASLNPFFPIRIARMKEKINKLKKLMQKKDFINFGQLVEAEALELHAIAFTSTPPILYWQAGTIKIIKAVQNFRLNHVPAFFTIDAGPHVHVLIQKENVNKVVDKLREIPEVREVIANYPSLGARLISNHLF
jgi:diphosphomevalonate decarboxylase